MKKLVLFIIMISLTGISMAQLQKNAGRYEKRVPQRTIHDGVNNQVRPVNHTVASKSALADELGTTRYDMQTNASIQNRFYTYPDGTMAGTWTMGQNDPDYADRGTGYSYFDGSSWSAEPTSRIESLRTGWPSYCPWNGNGELVIAHNSTTSLVMNTRPVKGTGAWTQKMAPTAPAGAPPICWPRAITNGTTHQNIHVIACALSSGNGGAVYNGLDGALLYWRSTDAGATWDKVGIQLPGITSDNYDGFSGEEYAWGTPHGDTIYFCAGGPYTDTFIMESPDNGETWTKIPILSNANSKIPTSITDIPPWYSPDGALACELGPGGVFHFSSGIGGGTVIGGTHYIMLYRNGLIYWNSTMPMLKDSLNLDTLQAHGQLLGYYSDGPNPADTLNVLVDYGCGLTSHPQLSIDGADDIVAIWDGVTYQNPEPSSGNNYRHIWERVGNAISHIWFGDQFDMNTGNLFIFQEFVYPSMAKWITTGQADYIDQTCNSPGSSIYIGGIAAKTWGIEHNSFITVGVPTHTTSAVSVSQNFPNPVKGTTKFNVTLDKGSRVIIEVSDVTGKKIMTMDKGFLTSGAHQFEIDASQMNAGVYFYCVKINGESFTQKMIVE